MTTKPRNYRAEYDKYQGTPEQRAKNNERHRAETAWVKANGPVPKGYVIDHKVPLSQGGSNALSNLRLLKRGDNASFDRAGPGGKQIGSAKGKGK